jgi:hypothetical protein
MLQRKCACGGSGSGECEACKEEKEGGLQRFATDRAVTAMAPPIVQSVLGSIGEKLHPQTRAAFEPRFGHDFSQVRVHTDSRAAESARAVNALAYTVGNEVVFAAGQYSPFTGKGQKLLAHELTHVVQQSGNTGPVSGELPIARHDNAAEKLADRASSSANFSSDRNAPVSVQRYSHSDCSEDDLRSHVWPSDYTARQMVAKAIRVLGASPSDPAVTPLLSNYFMTSSPTISTIVANFNKINDKFTKNDYTYECEESCSGNDNAYVYDFFCSSLGNIHLCMASGLRSWSNECVARAIVHEFGHCYAGLADNLYCNIGCVGGNACNPTCGAGLSASDAMNNADSYACFAWALYSVTI